MRGDRLGEFARRAGGKDYLAAIGTFIAQSRKNFGAIRKARRIDVDPRGDLTLQPRRAGHRPYRHHEQV